MADSNERQGIVADRVVEVPQADGSVVQVREELHGSSWDNTWVPVEHRGPDGEWHEGAPPQS